MRNCLSIMALMLFATTAWADEKVVDHVVVVFDDSGSMSTAMRSNYQTTRMEAAKAALTKVVQQVDEDAEIGIILLNSKWLVPLGKNKRSDVVSKIATIQPTGGTPLGETMKEGCDALLKRRGEAFYGSYRLLIVSDGEASDQNLVEKYLPDILSRGVVVDVIGVDMAQDLSLATKVKNYRRADDEASLEKAIAASFAETAITDQASLEDYELTAALPEDMVPKVLVALKNTGNHPIGEVAQVKLDEEGRIALDADGNPVTQSSGSSGFGWGLICIGVTVVIIIIGAIAVVSSGNR